MANTKSLTTSPYGSWTSKITADYLIDKKNPFDSLKTDDNKLYWSESRPAEQGRCVILQRSLDSDSTEVLPDSFSVKSRVHEYGGGAFCVNHGQIYFVNESDQQIYCLDHEGTVQVLTQTPGCRYADLEINSIGSWLLAVCEDHNTENQEPANYLVMINLHTGVLSELTREYDFYAFPRFNPDGTSIAWIAWNHPNMPWDYSLLYKADFNPQSGQLSDKTCVIDQPEYSVFQPEFSPDNTLYFVSDQTGWWNLYSENDIHNPIMPMNAEFGVPLWVLGQSSYRFLDANHIVCSLIQNGQGQLALIDIKKHSLSPINLPFSEFRHVNILKDATGDRIVCLAASGQLFEQLIICDPVKQSWKSLHSSSQTTLDTKWISLAQAITFESANQHEVHGFYYPPVNPDYCAPATEKPPLIVMTHGGPSAFSSNSLNLKVQYWTSRGFAVFDVNYRGSTGYGRHYRKLLDYQWGIADVQDCQYGALAIASSGLADSKRLLIRGGSAGGFTTLCALTFIDTFRAGASYYGISDLMILANDTHKFEARYLDRLVGTLPENEARYKQRSPINAVEKISRPIIFLQGGQDRVVPPSQAEILVNALREKKLPVAYVLYDNERHGFRSADAITHSIQAECYFYRKILGIKTREMHQQVAVNIENL